MRDPFLAFRAKSILVDLVGSEGIDVDSNSLGICTMRSSQNNVGSDQCGTASSNLGCSTKISTRNEFNELLVEIIFFKRIEMCRCHSLTEVGVIVGVGR